MRGATGGARPPEAIALGHPTVAQQVGVDLDAGTASGWAQSGRVLWSWFDARTRVLPGVARDATEGA